MDTSAVVLEKPESLALRQLNLSAPCDGDAVVDISYSGISTGTERLLWSGRMPHFPGMGYPLVPGYESVGTVVEAKPGSSVKPGDFVFVPGANCYGAVRGLFGGAAARVVVHASRLLPLDRQFGEQAVLLALAATAHHAIVEGRAPELIVGHGVLGRLLAKLAVLMADKPPVVWETNADRHAGAQGYAVIHPDDDARRDYKAIYDVSGDVSLLDALVQRMAPGGEIVLAGFYANPVSFAFPPAFMKEARFRIAAQWQPSDLIAVKGLAEGGKLCLDGLITHREAATSAPRAYSTAFNDPACLKMILDWRVPL